MRKKIVLLIVLTCILGVYGFVNLNKDVVQKFKDKKSVESKKLKEIFLLNDV